MAKVNRIFTPAVVKEVSPAQEVFHLELSAEEMAFIFLLVGNCTGNAIGNTWDFYRKLKSALQLEAVAGDTCNLTHERDTITIHPHDIQTVLSKRQK
ncbi:hypothetical protein 16Q_157 [Pseudomonas phage 16Q]|nr:hypothetical protein 16Q_157 [Pseudomonas phage 16Q]